MNCIKLLLLALLFSSFSCFADEERFGIVSSLNGILCASFGENPPPVGSVITIIETQTPQYFFAGKLEIENESCEALEKANVLGPYFIVTAERNIAGPFIGVAVLSKNSVSVVNNEVVLNSAISKGKINFKSCTSNEGLYFSCWLGQPPTGEQLWRGYYYLGYDVEPSCQEGSF